MPEVLPTIRVKSLENGAESIINTADFDPALHEKVGKERKQLKPDALKEKDADKK